LLFVTGHKLRKVLNDGLIVSSF